jgi:rSAM/selenodomain-associated transferase 1
VHRVLDPSIPNQVAGQLCALAIMSKAPQPGKVKTRLTPPLTPEEAACLNIAFLKDLARSIMGASQITPGCAVAVYTPSGSAASYQGILPDDFLLLPQRGEDFGQRLISAAEDLFRLGFGSLCLINSDSPTVPAQNFADAVVELAAGTDPIVLGPADDGGYYLIGLKQRHRRLFEGIDWSTERVLEQTKERAAELGLRVCELPTGRDIDDRQSLARLCDELFGPVEGRTEIVAPNTRAFLKQVRQRLL